MTINYVNHTCDMEYNVQSKRGLGDVTPTKNSKMLETKMKPCMWCVI